jgi:hypothetical protein
MNDVSVCHHQFIDAGSVLFAGTDGARSCRFCETVEVRVRGEWIAFEDYLKRRRSDRPPA